MVLHIELDRETDGRWIAEFRELPGVIGYGKTRKEAQAKVFALALQVLADRIKHGELPVSGRSPRVLKRLSFA